MKAAIVFLSVILVAFALPQQRGFVEDVEKIVQSAIAKANNDLDSVTGLVSGLSSDTSGKANSIIAAAKAQIQSAISNVENTVNGLLSKGGAGAGCAQSVSAELTQLKNIMAKNYVICAGNLANAVSTFEQTILKDVGNLKSNVSGLTALVDECSDNVLDVVFCALTKATYLEDLISSTVGSAKLSIKVTQSKATSTLKDIETCANKLITMATPKITKLATTVRQCS